MKKTSVTKWQLAYSRDILELEIENGSTPLEALEWRECMVPSSVQYSSFGLPLDELYRRDHLEKVAWMNDMHWLYRTTITMPEIGLDEEAVFLFNGIDYRYTIYRDGMHVCSGEGMFSSIEVPLSGTAAGQEVLLLVVIHPFEPGAKPYEQIKARYSMGDGWDFAPKLRSAGIWDEAELVLRDKLRVLNAYPHTLLTNEQRADVIVHAELSEKVDFGSVVIELDGIHHEFPIVHTDKLALPLNIPSPSLWWPNGYGDAQLVELRIELRVTGRKTSTFTRQVGLRAIDQIPCAGQGVEDIPLQLCINKHPIFLKGVNWVPLDSCPGSAKIDRYRTFLRQFREAGVNFIRVWGGGLKEKDDFYSLADEYGLMVMQEFPLACQQLARTERFLRLLAQEAISIIKKLQHHPSVVIWSGGNEHYHYWDRVDSGTAVMEETAATVRRIFGIKDNDAQWKAGADRYNEPSLALLGHLCAMLDGSRPYQITSAMEGEGEVHGIWNWNPRIGDHRYRDYDSLYAFWLDADRHLYSEASVSSIANTETIHTVCGTNVEAVPDQRDPIWQIHNAFHAAWDGNADLWLDLPSTEKLFGKLGRLENLVFANQWMQGEGGRFLIEEMRRKKGRVSGIIWWGVNEPWPSLAGNALIDYYGQPKLGWAFLANAFRPTILSLRYSHCIARSVKPELWISHDGHETFEGHYEVEMVMDSTSEIIGGKIRCGVSESVFVKELPRIRLTAGACLHVRCRLYKSGGDNPVHVNDYVFASNEDMTPFTVPTLHLLRTLFDS